MLVCDSSWILGITSLGDFQGGSLARFAAFRDADFALFLRLERCSRSNNRSARSSWVVVLCRYNPVARVLTSELDPNLFYRERSICHTALLPAETRYEGYLTGVKTVDGDYEKGKSRDELDKEPANGTMRIAIVTKERQEWCPVTIVIDFKDHFYANENDGWLSLTFPNDAELEAYGPWEPKGVILICFGNCDQGKCPQGKRRMNDQQLEITINNVPVTRLWSMSNGDFHNDCGIAQAADGWYFPKNDEGRFKVAVKVGPNGEQWLAYTRISSIIAL